jgi:hypothetical protein
VERLFVVVKPKLLMLCTDDKPVSSLYNGIMAATRIFDSMASRSGTAILPLHGGRVPPWLATRMSSLGAVIAQAIAHHYGRDEFLRCLPVAKMSTNARITTLTLRGRGERAFVAGG